MLQALLVDGAFAVTALSNAEPEPGSADVVASSISTVQVVSLLIGTVLPILVALVTKTVTSARTKSLLLLGLSALSGFLSEYVNNPNNFVWQQALLTFVMTFIVGVATYYGLWKPAGVAPALQKVGSK